MFVENIPSRTPFFSVPILRLGTESGENRLHWLQTCYPSGVHKITELKSIYRGDTDMIHASSPTRRTGGMPGGGER
jgi:hypothetical protein